MNNYLLFCLTCNSCWSLSFVAHTYYDDPGFDDDEFSDLDDEVNIFIDDS